MPSRRRYTAAQKAKALRLARDPLRTLSMVARQLGIPTPTVGQWVRAARRASQDLRRRPIISGRRRRYTAAQKAEAVRLVRDPRWTLAMVAHQLDIPLSTVCSWVLNAERAEQPDAWARRRQLLSRRTR